MATFLLTWNPDKWEWKCLPGDVAAVRRQSAAAETSWSTGGLAESNGVTGSIC